MTTTSHQDRDPRRHLGRRRGCHSSAGVRGRARRRLHFPRRLQADRREAHRRRGIAIEPDRRRRGRSISVDDENIRPHLLSPEFFDADRNPESTSARASSSATATSSRHRRARMAGASLPVEATGRLRGPVEIPGAARSSRSRSRRPSTAPPTAWTGRWSCPAAAWSSPTTSRSSSSSSSTKADAMRILAISGSLRSDSHNARLLRHARGAGARGRRDRDLGRPQGDPALRRGRRHRAPPPAPSRDLREAIADADGLLFATPEYNSSIPGVLKNAIDWASRPRASTPLQGKPAAVIGATTGQFGAVWAQAELRKVLASTGARVVDLELPVARGTSARRPRRAYSRTRPSPPAPTRSSGAPRARPRPRAEFAAA